MYQVLDPLDDEKRYPKSSSEPTAAVMSWQAWCEQMQAAEKSRRGDNGRFTTEQLTKLQEKDMLSMEPQDMDQYLDFYASTFLDNAEIQRTRDIDDFRNALYDIFPIDNEAQHPPQELSCGIPLGQKLEVVKAVHGAMNTMPVVAEDTGVLRVGQAYPIWKMEQNLPDAAKILYEQAAKIAGLSVNMLTLAVVFTEARVEQWKRAQKRQA
jgi:RNA polymerase I-specific transcription initiation factor RRN7